MIKIKAKLLITSVFFLLVLSVLAAAQVQHLEITDIDVDIDHRDGSSDSDNNLNCNDKLGDEILPGDIIKFDVEVRNNYTKEDDVEIEDVDIEIKILNIDDDDDLEEDDEIGDIREDDEESVTLEFEIPLEVEEGNFDIEIEVNGDDGNQSFSHTILCDLELEVEKERNQVEYTQLALSPETVDCNRFVRLDVGVINLGRDNEDDVRLTASNANLGISESKVFDLDDDPFDSDSKFFQSFTFAIEEDVRPGNYPFLVSTVFDDGDETVEQTAVLTVRACGEEEEPEVEEEPEEEEPEVVVVQPPVQQPPAMQEPVQPPVEVIEDITGASFFETTKGTATLISIYAVVIIILIGFIVWILRK